MSQVLWANGHKGSWDMGLLEHAVRGSLWPGVGPWDEHMGLIGPSREPSLVIVAGKYNSDADGIAYLRAGLDRLQGAVIAMTGDEELLCPSERLRGAARKLLLQWANPHKPIRGDRNLMLGWPEDCRAWLKMQPRLAASARRLWCWMGQDTHQVRHELVAALRTRQDGLLLPTPGFGQGLPRADYFRELAASCVVPCPPGPFSPETFRMYEALEAGCLPVVVGIPPNGGWTQGDISDYYAGIGIHVLPDSTWVGPFIDRYAADDRALQVAMTESLARWIGHKRKYALDLRDDLRAVGGHANEDANPITVIIPTSPVPCHPSADMLADCIAKVRAYPELRDAEILILVDGVRPDLEHRRDAYEEYKRVLVDRANWDADWFGTWPILFSGWQHQASMLKEAMRHVRTPYVAVFEHDTYVQGEVPWQGFIDVLDQNEDVNYIRLSIFHTVLPEHRHLYQGERELAGVPLIHTTQFSNRPHIARARWYREMLARYFPDDKRQFFEDRIVSPCEAGEVPGLFQYNPPGNILRSFTVDGRGADPKAEHEV